jgi:hypothetical protein
VPAYLLTWNPEKWPWPDLNETVRRVRAGQPVDMNWSSGNTKSIPVGSRVLQLK